MSESLHNLRSMSEEDLITKHDHLAGSTVVGVKYYLEELARRDQKSQADKILKLTRWIALLTLVVTLATAANVVLFALE